MKSGTINHTKINYILKKVNACAAAMQELSDAALQEKTNEFRSRFQGGESLDHMLPEAFAAIREAAKRVIGMYPYDVQVISGIVLHKGGIAEMKTGEGKTLSAIMPLYLNAVTGRGCILVTMNEYLAVRDANAMKPLYNWMGLSIATGCSDDPSVRITSQQKKAIYASDIVYTTNGSLGFDYLLENLASSLSEKYMRDFYYVIIDEADSVLLDSAQMPLVISGSPRVQSNLYEIADYFVSTLKEEQDYEKDTDNVWLTEEGIAKAERFFTVDNLFEKGGFPRMRQINLALRAHAMFERDKQYVVEEGKIKLLDEQSGRIIANTKLRSGQHQALEAKEHVAITRENRSMASVTYQDFFNLFPKVGGMTGTGIYDRAEFREVYHLSCVRIPTRKKQRRIDHKDKVYTTQNAQVNAAVEEVIKLHEKRQPILVIADSIATSNRMSETLLLNAIPHNVLNAYNIPKEADIIHEAGQIDAVTIATAVAGRGTDIALGEGAAELGGLAVIGIGRMENRRLEMQARGRSGRQGDPGFSRFYLSMQDKVIKDYGSPFWKLFQKKDMQLRFPGVRLITRKAQRTAEENARSARQSTLEFGDSLRGQRELIYRTRDEILHNESYNKAYFMEIENEVITDFLEKEAFPLNENRAARFVLDNISYELEEFPSGRFMTDLDAARDYLLGIAEEVLDQKINCLPNRKVQQKFFQLMILKSVDESWIEQVDYLQQLRQITSGRQYAQRNPMFEYHREAYRSFLKMQLEIKKTMMRYILLGEIGYGENGEITISV